MKSKKVSDTNGLRVLRCADIDVYFTENWDNRPTSFPIWISNNVAQKQETPQNVWYQWFAGFAVCFGLSAAGAWISQRLVQTPKTVVKIEFWV